MGKCQAKSTSDVLSDDYFIGLYRQLFELYNDSKGKSQPKRGRPTSYSDRDLIIFFTVMQVKRIFCFKSQYKWLLMHVNERKKFRFEELIPHRATLSRRFKTLEKTISEFIVFVGQWADSQDKIFDQHALYVDGSLFTSQGGKWHVSNRRENVIPEGARNIDVDSTWSKSGYHGWVQGYSLHLLTNYHGFPKLAQVETASYPETRMIKDNEAFIENIHPKYVIGDNGYHESMRIRRWANMGINLLTPAEKWKNGKFAIQYHKMLEQPKEKAILARRKTAIEPIFDLISKLIGTGNNHKQLPMKGLSNVRTNILLGVLSLQIIMISNHQMNKPFREISYFMAAFK